MDGSPANGTNVRISSALAENAYPLGFGPFCLTLQQHWRPGDSSLLRGTPSRQTGCLAREEPGEPGLHLEFNTAFAWLNQPISASFNYINAALVTERDRFQRWKRSLPLVHFTISGDTCLQGTRGA